MNQKDFDIEVEKSILRSKRLLNKKGIEYTQNQDRLGQFYRAAVTQSITPTEALMGMATKHITSIADMVKNPFMYPLRKWNEKLTDLRNYTILLDALLRDMEIQ